MEYSFKLNIINLFIFRCFMWYYIITLKSLNDFIWLGSKPFTFQKNAIVRSWFAILIAIEEYVHVRPQEQ